MQNCAKNAHTLPIKYTCVPLDFKPVHSTVVYIVNNRCAIIKCQT